MSDRTTKLLLIDQDQIFRTGLRTVIEQFSDLQVVAEADTGVTVLRVLSESERGSEVDLVILEPLSERSSSSRSVNLELCRQLKSQYPSLPVLLLTQLEPTQLAAARQTGVDGYCPKGVPVSELIAAIRQVAAGRAYWVETTTIANSQPAQQISVLEQESENQPPVISSLAALLRNHLRLSGIQNIDATLTEVTARLQVPGLPLLEQAVLAGQRRELLAARWLITQLFAAPKTNQQPRARSQPTTELVSNLEAIPATAIAQPETTTPVSFRTIQSVLFANTLEKLQLSLQNLTRTTLEIDILREEKQRELLYLILRKVENILDELRFSQVQPQQLAEMQRLILRDLWQAAITDFFGKYSTLQVGKETLEIANIMLQDVAVVQTEILAKIPLTNDLFSYLLFETPLVIDNASYAVSSPEVMARAEIILQNLLVQIANAVVQPLLNRFGDVELIKQNFYDRSLISTREIERFRNNLSWKYRLSSYVGEPQAIFESRYQMLVLTGRGIAKISIYAPRREELAQLSGIQLAVTLALETRDAIAPRLRAVVAFLGNGVVYILTQVVGRAIGLIGRGILQGIGGSLPEGRNKKF